LKKLLIGTVITPFRIIKSGAVLIEDKRILAVDDVDKLRDSAEEIIDFSDLYIAPGFVDIHVHGGGGKDTMDGTLDALKVIAETHAKGGTTTFLPTTTTAPIDDIYKALKVIKQAMSVNMHDFGGARIVGAHLEGPYFNYSQAGAQNPAYLKNPNWEEMQTLLSTGIVRRVSLAPELPGALEMIKNLESQGVIVSIGHSDATYQQVIKAMEMGCTHVTHIYSGMSMVKRVKSYRISGVLESALLEDELTVELIADGHHLPPSLIKLIVKVKGFDHVCGITDAISAAGIGPGQYTSGGLEVIVENTVPNEYETIPSGYVAKLSNREAFAGSTALMINILNTLVELSSIPLQLAVKMITYNPAKIIKISNERGSIAPGKYADIVVFDRKYRVQLNITEGIEVFKSFS